MTRKNIKPERLKSATEISSIFSKNQRVSSRIGLILWKKSENQDSHVAYCVSKKHGKAVRRNRIKRVLRQLVWSNLDLIPEKVDFVVLPSTRQPNWSTPKMQEDFQVLLKKFNNKISN